jgi:hypothetical protein
VPHKTDIPAERLAALRSAAQLLHRPRGHEHPADVARAIGGAQAQEAGAGRLAFRARSARVTAADVDRARTEERSLVRTWAMRQTIHLLAADDVPWLLPLYDDALSENSRRRLTQLGVEPAVRDRALRELRRALSADGPLTRDELVERLERKGVSLDTGQRLHMFRLAVSSGIACLGPDRGRRTCLVMAEDWLGPRPPHDRDAALAELTRRYVRAFAPATEVDFAGWSGLGLRDVRAGLASIASELREVRVGGAPAWTLERAARLPRGPVVRLLPAWDTYLMGHRDRHFIAGPDWPRIMRGGGILAPAILVDGVAVGTWKLNRSGRTWKVEIDPFGRLDRATTAAIKEEVEDVARFEGAPVELTDADW